MKNEQKLYYLGGVNGVGKTTFEHHLMTSHPERFEVVHGAGKLMQYLGLQPGDYAGLRATARNVKAEAFANLVADLTKDTDGRSKILSTHFAILTQGQIEWNRKEPWLSNNVDALVLLRAPLGELFARITADARDRKLFGSNASKNEQKAQLRMFVWRELQRARSLARQHNLPLLVFDNAGSIDELVATFVAQHDQYLGSTK